MNIIYRLGTWCHNVFQFICLVLVPSFSIQIIIIRLYTSHIMQCSHVVRFQQRVPRCGEWWAGEAHLLCLHCINQGTLEHFEIFIIVVFSSNFRHIFFSFKCLLFGTCLEFSAWIHAFVMHGFAWFACKKLSLTRFLLSKAMFRPQ